MQIYVRSLTPTNETWKTESCAGPCASVGGIVTVKFWCGGKPSGGDWNCGLKGPLKSIDPKNEPGGKQAARPHDSMPITTATSIEPVKES